MSNWNILPFSVHLIVAGAILLVHLIAMFLYKNMDTNAKIVKTVQCLQEKSVIEGIAEEEAEALLVAALEAPLAAVWTGVKMIPIVGGNAA